MMDREGEAQELPAGGGEEHERVDVSRRGSQEEDTDEEESDDEKIDDEKITPKEFWITGLPDPKDAEFRKFTHRTSDNDTHHSSFYEPGDKQYSMWESHPDHECYSSFGDGGTTATVNAFGQLMQFSTYLGPGNFGMFSVDHTSIYEPWLMDTSIGVIVSVFIDGVAMKFHSSEKWNLTVEIKQTREVVVAYKLVYSISEVSNDWKQFLVEADKANVDNLLLKEFKSTQYHPIPLFSLGDCPPNVSVSKTTGWDKIKSNLDFIFQRHLEHLLTVCAIPITSCQGGNDTSAVALTCGDISAHRICTSASLNILTDTAFQIIKAGEFAEHYSKDPGKNEWQLARKFVGLAYSNWITHLDELDKRGKFAWPRSRREEFGVFRLDDHVWAIRALKIAESMISTNKLEGDIPEQTIGASTRPTKSVLAKEYSFANTQREVVQRFTIQNPIYQSKKRMLAVTRSARESRFLFHARDSALFYNAEQVEWRGTQFIELLKNTIDSQQHHVDNEESGWDNTLRYALAIITGTGGYKINAKSSFELVQSSINVLFGSFSSNGFVPGQLDKDTKEQALFEEEEYADSYYHASFEIPYILLQYASRIHSLYKTQLSETTTSGASANAQSMTDLDNPQHTKPQRSESIVDTTLVSIPADEQNQPAKVSDAMRARANLTMKKTTPFNDLVDITNIVDRDDEWLYNYPSIFSRKVKIDFKKALESAKAGANYSGIGNSIIRKELDNLKASFLDLSCNSCFVVDTHKAKHLGKGDGRDDGIVLLDRHRSFWDTLGRSRTPELAKKRLIWMPLVGEFQAGSCYLATPEIHQMSISSFFDRHVKNESYFFEDTALVENAWETEFHLSFYSLIDSDSNHAEGIATSSAEGFPGSNQKKKIALGSMGFRFDGDIFDRYWTGYLVENVPGLYREDYSDYYYPDRGHQPLFIESNDKAYRQRKVLELHFFDRMIEQIVRCTQKISHSIREELGMKQGALSSSILSSDDYFNSRDLWNKYQHILHIVEEELESAIGVIGKWEKREDDRKGEEPRWTRNDEIKYRGIINKAKGSTKRRVMDLHVAYRNIKTLRETIENSQDQIRNDLSLQGSENIRFFTYVTVVFLPLGFATGIFSMSGAPDGKVLGSMAVCAVVALLLTVLALLNAKQLAKIVDDLFSVYHRYSQAKMERSLIVYDKKKRRNTSQDVEEADVEGADKKHDRVKLKVNSLYKQRKMAPRIESWTLLFWVHYFKFMVFQLTTSPEPKKDSDNKYKERLNMLIHPPDVARPIKLLVKRLKEPREDRRKRKEKELEEREKRKKTAEERNSDNDSEIGSHSP
ncbi:hypothetical protein BHYA_0046g00040 [Botrytis hyacinthi]|uniref:Uncharacterized protein n=1 Tax=Botrytis hyacinthi TaxID=278943 RepID=A0A4Z1GXI2_9HELO|nr:hypothetical protein BHYA_0046g00040 [Botrytis hyacinthi]